MRALPAPASSVPGRNSLSLAVVVPATDEPATLERCLAAIAAGERVPDELIVQRGPRGSGPAAARNAAVARLEADVVVFVDSDVEAHPDALARIERRFVEDSGLAAVFGAYDDDPAAPGLTSRFRNLLHHHVHVSSAGEAETFWAGLGAVRYEAFQTVGGFDAARFREPSVEDVELGMRLRAAGHRIVLDPEIRGRHLKAWAVLTMVRTDFSRRGLPWARLLLRRGRDATPLNLGWRHRASAAVSLLLTLSLLVRRPRFGLGALLGLLVLNRRFYLLLFRRGGPRLFAGGVGLHVVHHLTGIAAFAAALATHRRDGR